MSGGVGCSPAHRQRKGAGKRPPSFVRCRRAAATAIGAAIMTLMSVGGFALTSDHIHLVHQRDTLKAATDAASFATSREWQQVFRHLTDDDQIKAALLPMARRYILANMPENQRENVESTLHVQLVLHHGAGTVDVNASADLSDGLLFSGWMFNGDTSETPTTMRVETRTERLESESGTIELVLAIDSTNSMNYTLSGNGQRSNSANFRLTIVKQAAKNLVDILTAATDSVAVGIVPWNYVVRVDEETSTRWKDNSWAVLPTRHYYPHPYHGSHEKIPRASTENWFPDPHLLTSAGEWHDLPAMRGPWAGCVDPRRMSGANPPGLSAVLPTVNPFTMAFYSPIVQHPSKDPVSYLCRRTDPLPERSNRCYHNPSGLTYSQDKVWWDPMSQSMNCYDTPAIVPLETDTARVKRKIDALSAKGSATYSKLGVVWGHRLLAPTWRMTWNSAKHPVDKAEDVQKVLVLLTDGEDNHLDPDIVTQHLNDACTAAKNAGIKVFTIAAMNPSLIGDLGDNLTRCSSQTDDPDGTYVFINNATSDDLRGTFQEIARQLVRFRRVY